MLDIKAFTQTLNKQIQYQKIQNSTAKQYLQAAKMFNTELSLRGIKGETLLPTHLTKEIILELAHDRPEQIKLYMAMISVYGKGVWGNADLFLSSRDKVELRRKAERLSEPIEPRYSYQGQMSRINQIPDMDIRLALRMQLACGVRISELCKIRKKDVHLDTRQVFIRRDKGGGRKVAYLMPNKWVDEQLQKYMEGLGDEDVLFPMQNKITLCCNRRGIKSHDNRKHYIRRLYSERVEENVKGGRRRVDAKKEALEWTRHMVGHRDVDMTKWYLGSVWRKRTKKKEKKEVNANGE